MCVCVCVIGSASFLPAARIRRPGFNFTYVQTEFIASVDQSVSSLILLTPFLTSLSLALVEQVPLRPSSISGDPLGEISEWQAIESAPAKYHNTYREMMSWRGPAATCFLFWMIDSAAQCSVTTTKSRRFFLPYQRLCRSQARQVPYNNNNKDLESSISVIYPRLPPKVLFSIQSVGKLQNRRARFAKRAHLFRFHAPRALAAGSARICNLCFSSLPTRPKKKKKIDMCLFWFGQTIDHRGCRRPIIM